MFVEQFAPKPEVNLEAVQFEGGVDNGKEIVSWIVAGGGQAIWVEENRGEWNRCGMQEHIRVIKGDAYMFAYVGDYIFKDETYGFKPVRQGKVLAKYNKIEVRPVLQAVSEELLAA